MKKQILITTSLLLLLGSHLLDASVRFAFESTDGSTTISGVLTTTTTEAELDGSGVIRSIVTGAESLFINGSRVTEDLSTATVRAGATGQTTNNTDSFFYNLDTESTEPSNGNAIIFDSNGGTGSITGWQIGHGHIESFRHFSFSFGNISTEDGPKSFSFVATSTTYTPLLPVTVFDVTFSEGDHGQRVGGGALVQSVAAGSSAVAPIIEPDFGWDFIGWDLSFQTVNSNLTVTARYEVASHAVNFLPGPNAVRAGGGELSQSITHGEAALAPILSVASGFVFTGWDNGFDAVTADLTVTAQFGTDFNNSDADDDAVLTGDREPPADDSTETVEVGSLTVNTDTAFELGPMETLVLNSGPLTISEGASFTANGTIIGSVINAGLLRIPVLNLPDIVNTGVIEVFVEIATTLTQPIRMDGGLVRFSGEETTIDVARQENDGILATDASLEVTGDFDQSSTGSLRLFISGDVPGETYSQLKTGGNVTLDGSLQIVFRPDDLSFLPRPNDTFDFVLTDPSSTIVLAPGFSVVNLVEATQTGAFDEDGIVHIPFDSGLASGVDPDELRQIDQQLFALSLAEGDTILRATYIGPDLTDFYENAPTDILASANTVSESDGIGTLIATLSAVDASGGPHSFALVAGDGNEDNGLFDIVGSELRTAALLDFEQNSSHSIRLRATDPQNRHLEKIFIVQILNATDDDDDDDGLTEAEEIALGTQAQVADSDGDGISDGDEVNGWGTDPLNNADRMRFTGNIITVDGPQVTLEWSTVVGKAYKIEGNQTLDAGGWAEVPGTFNGTGGSVSATIDTTGSDYRFFRVKPL